MSRELRERRPAWTGGKKSHERSERPQEAPDENDLHSEDIFIPIMQPTAESEIDLADRS